MRKHYGREFKVVTVGLGKGRLSLGVFSKGQGRSAFIVPLARGTGNGFSGRQSNLYAEAGRDQPAEKKNCWTCSNIEPLE